MKHTVIYRKYRPTKFAEVVGQDIIVDILKAQIITKRIGNAYLFCGQHGVGKTTVARLFSKAVNCENFHKQSDVCNVCDYCKHFESTALSDFIEIDGASNRGIDEIRNISEQIRYPPSILKYKIYIIDEAHMITGPAFNAFLKTLEEPPPYVIFILATTEVHKLPKTILSRLQIFEFKKATKNDIRLKIQKILVNEKVDYDEAVLGYISDLGKGSFRDAESSLNKVLLGGKKKLTLAQVKEVLGLSDFVELQKFLELLLSAKIKEALIFLNVHMVKSARDFKMFGENLLVFLCNVVIAHYGSDLLDPREFTQDEMKALVDLSKKAELKKFIKLIDVFREAYQNVYQYPYPYIPFEVAVIEAVNILKAKV